MEKVLADVYPKTFYDQLTFGVFVMLILLAVTIVIEAVPALIYALVRGLNVKRILLSVLMANIVSYPIFFITLSALLSYRYSFVPLEILVVCIELAVISKVARIDIREGAILSLIINTVSFSLPWIF